MEEIWLVSACLLGEYCRYNGLPRENAGVRQFLAGKRYMGVCPETLGGLTVPRPPAEITGGGGDDVLQGKATVIRPDGTEVTEFFIRGAQAVLDLARRTGAVRAVLKADSPSCGNARIYDGTFSKNLIPGRGVTAALLARHGVEVLSEKDL
ncbi:MAG: DUF523 domain-containing protein [Bacillota bacterium]